MSGDRRLISALQKIKQPEKGDAELFGECHLL